MNLLKLKIGNYAIHYDEYDGYGFNSIIDMEILGIDLYNQFIDHYDWTEQNFIQTRYLGQYNGIKHKPSDKDILVKKFEDFDDEIFDIYNLKLDEKYKEELEQEMKSKITMVMTKNKINIPKLKINVNDDILLTKEQVELIREGKIILNPYVRFNYGTTKTNRDVGLEVVTSLELNIGINIEKENIEVRSGKENVDVNVDENQSYLEWFVNWMYDNIIGLYCE